MADFDVYEQVKAKRKAIKRAREFIKRHEWMENAINSRETMSVYVDCSMTNDSFLGLGVCMTWDGKIQTMSTLEEYCDTTINGELRAVLYGIQCVSGLLQVTNHPKQVIIYSDLLNVEEILSGQLLVNHLYVQDTLREIYSAFQEFLIHFPQISLEIEYLPPDKQCDNLLYSGAHHVARTVTKTTNDTVFQKVNL